jgi:hypothetical protein
MTPEREEMIQNEATELFRALSERSFNELHDFVRERIAAGDDVAALCLALREIISAYLGQLLLFVEAADREAFVRPFADRIILDGLQYAEIAERRKRAEEASQ